MDNLLRQLDRKSQQVEIEARVVAANRSFSREIGTQFGFSAGANPSGSNIVGGASGVGTSPVVRNFPPLPAPPVIVGTGGATSTQRIDSAGHQLAGDRADQRLSVLVLVRLISRWI